MKVEDLKRHVKRVVSVICLVAMLSASPLLAAMADGSDAAFQEATSVAEPKSAAVPEPTATPEPEPTATPEPEPTATPEPEPTATPEPKPTAAPEPTEAPALEENTVTAESTASESVSAGAAASQSGGSLSESGGRLYYYINGVAQTGLQKVNGKIYYFSPGTGVAAAGWQKINGIWYYFGYSEKAALKGIVAINGKWYYFNAEGKMQEGLKKVDGKLYYFIPGNGAAATGWQKINGLWYYFGYSSKAAFTHDVIDINGKWYYFSDDGVMQEGLHKINGKIYYFTPGHGSAATGWQKINGIWYYFGYGDKAAFTHDVIDINGKWYYFNDEGMMQEGLREVNGRLYYFTPGHGSAATGWRKINDKWYYFSYSEKAALTGLLEINSKLYYLGDDGVMREGMYEINGDLYYFATGGSGAAISGWIQVGGKWFYFDSTTKKAVKGRGQLSGNGKVYYLDDNWVWKTTPGEFTAGDGSKYIINSDGTLYTGWSNGRYFGATTGKMLTGVWTIGGNLYCFHPETGRAQSGWQTVDGKTYFFSYYNSCGLKGWQTINNKTYYFSKTTGVMLTGWQTYNDYSYYLYTGDDGGERGVMATNTVIDGITIGADGKVLLGVRDAMVRTAQSYSSPTDYLILTDTINCKVGVFTGSKGNWSLLYYWDCNCGAYGHDTPTGLYSIGSRYYSFGNSTYTAYYGTSFLTIKGRAQWLFHSVLYIPGTSWLQDGRLGYHGSNGCVRLATSNSRWIYNNVPEGTTVVNY